MAVIVIGHERVRDNPDRVKRRQPLEQSYKHFLLGVAEWPVSPRSHSPVVAVVPRILAPKHRSFGINHKERKEHKERQ